MGVKPPSNRRVKIRYLIFVSSYHQILTGTHPISNALEPSLGSTALYKVTIRSSNDMHTLAPIVDVQRVFLYTKEDPIYYSLLQAEQGIKNAHDLSGLLCTQLTMNTSVASTVLASGDASKRLLTDK